MNFYSYIHTYLHINFLKHCSINYRVFHQRGNRGLKNIKYEAMFKIQKICQIKETNNFETGLVKFKDIISEHILRVQIFILKDMFRSPWV